MESDFVTSALMMEERFSQNVLEIKVPKVYIVVLETLYRASQRSIRLKTRDFFTI